MHKLTLGLVSLALLATAACGSSSDAKPSAERTWPASGKPLSAYKAYPDYQQRVNLLDHRAAVDDRLSGLGLDSSAYDDLINTCSSIDGGVEGAKLVKTTRVRFGMDAGAAHALIAVAREDVC